MKNTSERRQMILETLCQRRYEKIENLATEFEVSRRTITYDIQIKHRERKRGNIDLERIKEMERLPADMIFFTIDEQTTERGQLKISPTFIKESKEMFGRLLLGDPEIVKKIKRS